MPLIKSGSRKAISTNIREMIAAGHPHDQAVAAALHTADKYRNAEKRADGGRVDYPKVGLAENPPGVHFHCPECKFFDAGRCMHKDPKLHGRRVTTRHCCDLYEHTGMKVIVK